MHGCTDWPDVNNPSQLQNRKERNETMEESNKNRATPGAEMCPASKTFGHDTGRIMKCFAKRLIRG